jgi:hypothetical protein
MINPRLSKTRILLTLILIGGTLNLQAQRSSDQSNTAANSYEESALKKNFIKINLTAIAIKNYSIQYERVVNKSISVAVSYRNMPSTSIPFKKLLKDAAAEDGEQETIDAIEKLRLSNYAITPELRFYVGKKGYGRGFYIAPFYRYAVFNASNIAFEYGDNLTFQNEIALSGKLTSNTGGIMFGAQWALGKTIVLDWWIFGPHYGAANGTFSGLANKPLTQTEQQELRENLEDIDIPLTTKTVIVNSAGATLKLDGPWAGVRGGISLGVRF